MKPRKALVTMTVRELVRLCGSTPGAHDFVGPEIRRRGTEAQDELIRMLDATPGAEMDGKAAETITEMLQYQFPTAESRDALERHQSRRRGPLRGAGDLSSLTSVRVQLSGQMDEAWWKEHQSKSPAEAHLHSMEIDLAHARPQDRVAFLADAVRAALDCYQDAVRMGDPVLRSVNEAKAESYAREILAIPDLASKSGDGVFQANHVLGMLALEHGDADAAKRYLIEASKTPGSWMLNRLPGPDWRLAIALLQHGEREVVCEFLDNVKVFIKWEPAPAPKCRWKGKLIDIWKEKIRAGETSTRNEWVEQWFYSKTVPTK